MIETFFDVLLVEEIPVVNAADTGLVGIGGQAIVTTQRAVGKPPTGTVICAAPNFPLSGVMVDNPYKAGDVISSQEFGRNYELSLNRLRRSDLPQYFTIRVADVEGKVID